MKCPDCSYEMSIFDRTCPRCEHYSKVKPPVPLVAASPATFGVAGSIALLFALFAPLATVPVLGSITYIKLGWQWVAFAILIAVALTTTLLKKFQYMWLIAALMAGLACYTFTNIQNSLVDLRQLSEPSASDDAGASIGKVLATLFTASSGLEWAWPIVIVGVGFLYASWILTKLSQNNRRQRRSSIIASCFAIVAPLIVGSVVGKVAYDRSKSQLESPRNSSAIQSHSEESKAYISGPPLPQATSLGEEAMTPLATAAGISDYDQASYLLDNGADVNARDKDGMTPLFEAALPGDSKMVRLVLEKGADPNIKDNNGDTALSSALTVNPETDERYKTVELLLDHKADVNNKNNNGETPLIHAASDVDAPVIRLLIARGADVNARDNYGQTALDRAISNKDTNVAEVLKDAGERE